MLVRLGEDAGGKYRVAVVDENLDGRAVDENAEVLQSVFKRPCAALALGLVETDMHAAPVDGDLFFLLTVADGESALSVFVRKHIQTDIAFAAVQFHLRRDGKGKTPGLVGSEHDLLLAEFFELRKGLLDQTAAAHSQLAGKGQASCPVLFVRRVRDIRHSHPGDQDGLVGILQVVGAGGCIGIKSEVEYMELSVGREGEAVPVHMAQDIAVVVLALAAAGKSQVLRAQQKDIRAAQMLDGRAFPHVAEILESGNLQLALKGPSVLEVLGRIDQYTSALIQSLRADDHVVFFLPGDLDDLGIALVLGVTRMRAEKRQGVFLRPAVLAQTGQAGVGMPRPVRISVVAGIIEIDLVADGHCGTGVDTLVVIAVLLIGQKADAEIAPGHQILGNDVIPVLESVHSAPGAPLIEKVPAVVVPDKSVGIIHQAGHRLIVEMLTVDGGGNLLVQLAQFLRILQITILFFLGPFSHIEISFPPETGLHATVHLFRNYRPGWAGKSQLLFSLPENRQITVRISR